MDEGKIVAQERKDKILSQPELLKKYGIKPPELSELFFRLGIPCKEINIKKATETLKSRGWKLKKDKAQKILEQEKTDFKLAHSPIFEIRELYYAYPNQAPASKGINLNEGDFLAIIGQNGSGKTTLVKHLNGLFLPSKGIMKYRGKKISSKDITKLSQKIGFVFQNPNHHIFSSRVYDEVAFAPRNYRFSEKVRDTKK